MIKIENTKGKLYFIYKRSAMPLIKKSRCRLSKFAECHYNVFSSQENHVKECCQSIFSNRNSGHPGQAHLFPDLPGNFFIGEHLCLPVIRVQTEPAFQPGRRGRLICDPIIWLSDFSNHRLWAMSYELQPDFELWATSYELIKLLGLLAL